MTGDWRVRLPGGLGLRFVAPPALHRRYVERALCLRAWGEPGGELRDRDAAGPDTAATLTVRFVRQLPRQGRSERIGAFAGWCGDRFWVGDLRGARLAWAPEQPVAEEWQCERAFAPDALWAYLWWALRAAWRERGAVMLHASAAVRQGQGLVLMGWSGAGKSTVLRELLGRGAGFLGDDWVLLSRGRAERCSGEIRAADGRRRAVTKALPGVTVWEEAPLAAVCLLLTAESGEIAAQAWDGREVAVRMAACLRFEGAVFAHACDAFRFFRPGIQTPFDESEARDAALLTEIFGACEGSAWSIPRGATPRAAADAITAWLDRRRG